MDSFLKLVLLLSTIFVVHSRELKFVTNENIIYDCVDINKQPSLSHPLLKNHKIQMEPSFSVSKSKYQMKQESENNECPDGTVPILKNTTSYAANAQYLSENNFNPLTTESHGTHIAGVRSEGQGPYRGLAAYITVHDLNISRDQASYAHIYIGSGLNNKVNFIQTGWMINPSLFGDGRTWSYGFWKGANGAGCYNTICPGFVQVSKISHLSGPLINLPKGRAIYVSIQQDKKSGNWWTTDVQFNAPDIHIGYWPKELFDQMGNGADIVGVTGSVQASPSGISPPMGSGSLPTENDKNSARVEHFEIIDSNFNLQGSDKYKLQKLLDNNKCYGLIDGKKPVLFKYGGPGGNSCGI